MSIGVRKRSLDGASVSDERTSAGDVLSRLSDVVQLTVINIMPMVTKRIISLHVRDRLSELVDEIEGFSIAHLKSLRAKGEERVTTSVLVSAPCGT